MALSQCTDRGKVKNLKTYVYPADENGCGYYRLIWPAREVAKCGMDVEIVMPKNRNNLRAVMDGDRVVDVVIPDDADIIVLQRVSHYYLAQAIKVIRAKGVAVVVDMDDDLANIHPHNPAWINFHPSSGLPGSPTAQHNWHNAQVACDNASLVTVSSDRLLKRYARHGRGVVLRNAIPRHYLDVEHHDSAVFGWGGSLASHPTDLQQMGFAPVQLQRAGWEFRVIGDPGGVKATLGLDREPTASGIVSIDAWPHALSQLGVGVAPLDDTVFNAAKSWLKPLEMAAVGVPMVMSPRHEYTLFHENFGVGLLARKPAQWIRHVRALLQDDAMRRELGEKARTAVSNWTYDNLAYRWLNAWTSAYADR